MREPLSALAVAFALAAACGGRSSLACGGTTAGGDDASDTGDASAFDAGPVDDTGFTACTTPEGFRVCGARAPCPYSDEDPACRQCAFQTVYGVGLCDSTSEAVGIRLCDSWCPDTEVCSTYLVADAGGGNCIPFSLGVLLEKYSADPSIVRYSDFSSWTGDAVPNPSSCPAVAGFQTCGGDCGGCPPGTFCSGRSTRHPVGACVSLDDYCWIQPPGNGFPAKRGCPSGDSCFLFTVDPASQAFANENGGCMPSAQCQALAADLPGGGTCVSP